MQIFSISIIGLGKLIEFDIQVPNFYSKWYHSLGGDVFTEENLKEI